MAATTRADSRRSRLVTTAIGALAAAIYTWDLGSVGDANSYYTAAVRSATESWKAFFFGSLDPASFITVDKPPASIWLMALSTRIFGFNSWAMLLPQAVLGVASVMLLHRLVRSWAGEVAAHLAALAFALTPVAAVMFRYNNPDALLTFLCLGAAWAVWRAVETGHTRFVVLTGALLGLAFLTKMLQAFLVLPAFGVVYLVAGPPTLAKRSAQLLAGLGALIVSAGWWVAVVELWPESSRPYIGGSQENSVMELVLGYNGLGRIFGGDGNPGGSVAASAPGGGAGPNGGGFGGDSGWLRLFNTSNGGQISWLLPLAAAGLLGGLWLTRRRVRTDRMRAGWILWGTWAITCWAVFSFSRGIYHEYYAIQLAPAVAALAGTGGVALWRLGAAQRWMRWCLPTAVALSAAWSLVLLGRTPGYLSWARAPLAAGAGVAAFGFCAAWLLRRRPLVVVAAVASVLVLLVGPAAFTGTSVASASSGPLMAAGPGRVSPNVSAPDSAAASAPTSPAEAPAEAPDGAGAAPRGPDQDVDADLLAYLEANREGATFLVATFGSMTAGRIIIETGDAVMAIGGFNGSDPAPTLEGLQELVAAGEVRFVLLEGWGGPGASGGPGGPGGPDQGLVSWIVGHGTEVPASEHGGGAGITLYDLRAAA